MLDEGAKLAIFDPKVKKDQVYLELSNSQLNLPLESVKASVEFFSNDPLDACQKSHAIVVCTEWDMFKVNSNIQKDFF